MEKNRLLLVLCPIGALLTYIFLPKDFLPEVSSLGKILLVSSLLAYLTTLFQSGWVRVILLFFLVPVLFVYTGYTLYQVLGAVIGFVLWFLTTIFVGFTVRRKAAGHDRDKKSDTAGVQRKSHSGPIIDATISSEEAGADFTFHDPKSEKVARISAATAVRVREEENNLAKAKLGIENRNASTAARKAAIEEARLLMDLQEIVGRDEVARAIRGTPPSLRAINAESASSGVGISNNESSEKRWESEPITGDGRILWPKMKGK